MSPGAGSGSRSLGVRRAGQPDGLPSLFHRAGGRLAGLDVLPAFQDPGIHRPEPGGEGCARRVQAPDGEGLPPLSGRGGGGRYNDVSAVGAAPARKTGETWGRRKPPRGGKSLRAPEPVF